MSKSIIINTIQPLTFTSFEQTPAIVVTSEGEVVDPANYSVSYAVKEGDPNASLGENGQPVNAGNYVVSVVGSGEYSESEASSEFTVNPADLSSATFSISPTSYAIEAGGPFTPTPTLYIGRSKTKYTLVADEDYSVSYVDNTTVGTAQVVISPVVPGNFSGSVSKNFSILNAVATVENGEGSVLYYETLSKAFSNAKEGNTVKLISDISFSSTAVVKVGGNLDLNGKTITFTGTSTAISMNGQAGCTLSVSYGKIVSSGTGIKVSAHNHLNISEGVTIEADVDGLNLAGGDASINVDGGTISGQQCGIQVAGAGTPETKVVNIDGGVVSGQYGVYNDRGIVNLTDGEVRGSICGIAVKGYEKQDLKSYVNISGGVVAGTGEGSAIAGSGNAGYGGYEIVITNGTVSSEDVAIYHCNKGSLTISGGTITGTTAVYQKCGTTSITGGNLVSTGPDKEYEYNGNGANATGDTVVVDNCGYPGGTPEISISGGTFRSEHADSVGSYAYNADPSAENPNVPIEGFVQGGTFKSPLPANMIKEGYEMDDQGRVINPDDPPEPGPGPDPGPDPEPSESSYYILDNPIYLRIAPVYNSYVFEHVGVVQVLGEEEYTDPVTQDVYVKVRVLMPGQGRYCIGYANKLDLPE